jgi:DMSO/TMAO reductase YedYZ heme-binding membrane subunit
MAARRGGFEGGRVLAAIALALGAITALVIATAGTGEDGVRALIRATARTSVSLFLLAFVASSLRRLWPAPFTTWLVRNRRFVGLGFALSHAIHATAIASLAAFFPSSYSTTDPITKYAGGIGLVVVLALAATSNDAAVRRLGAARWRKLHRFGVWYVFVVFAFTYARAAVGDWTYVPGAAAMGAALALRFAAWRTATRERDRSSLPAPARSA